MSATINAGTVEGLLEFCDYLVDKGYGAAAAISPWKSAVKPIFHTVEEGDYLGVDVRALDLDEYFARFEIKARGNYKQESIAAYRSRFTKAISAYRAFLNDGTLPSFRAPKRREGGSTGRSGGNARQAIAAAPVNDASAIAAPPITVQPASLIDYPFPLRSGQVAQLRLPMKLDREDAERIAAFVRTLVFEPQRQLETGTESES